MMRVREWLTAATERAPRAAATLAAVSCLVLGYLGAEVAVSGVARHRDAVHAQAARSLAEGRLRSARVLDDQADITYLEQVVERDRRDASQAQTQATDRLAYETPVLVMAFLACFGVMVDGLRRSRHPHRGAVQAG